MVNLSLTKPMQVWVSDSDGTGLRARQSQEQADGVTPAGFFLCPWSSQLARPLRWRRSTGTHDSPIAGFGPRPLTVPALAAHLVPPA